MNLLEREISHLVFGFAKSVVTKEMVIAWADDLIQQYTANLLAQTKVIRAGAVPKHPLVLTS